MPEIWRLIADPPLDGATNMAIDEAILDAVGRFDAPPTLRLFRWEPACLSLGYAQPVSDVDRERLAARGWHLVRRMTGGRAILHVDELTYSVALPTGHPLAAGTIVESYQRLSKALLAAVEQLGLAAHAAPKSADRPASGPVCFEVPSDYEITANGKKLVGSAQVRKQNAALQHGSLPLTGDVMRIADALAYPDDETRARARLRIAERATTFAGAAGREATWEQAADRVAACFAAAFDLDLRPGALSEAESARAAELRATRYAADSWTLRL
ncbi:MAG: lipoate--protein ligase family protein [Anaerolineae bacterium]|nr:lipoate--protein ligase family protein [Anaerolineae bacterium]